VSRPTFEASPSRTQARRFSAWGNLVCFWDVTPYSLVKVILTLLAVCSAYSLTMKTEVVVQWNLYLSFPDNSFSRIRRSISMVPERILFQLWLLHLFFSRIHCLFFRPPTKTMNRGFTVPPKRRQNSSTLHDVTYQKRTLFKCWFSVVVFLRYRKRESDQTRPDQTSTYLKGLLTASATYFKIQKLNSGHKANAWERCNVFTAGSAMSLIFWVLLHFLIFCSA
jgi:hypothetical protein